MRGAGLLLILALATQAGAAEGTDVDPAKPAKPLDCAEETARGDELVKAGDYGQAETVLAAAIEVCKTTPGFKSTKPFIALGKVFMAQERYEQAVPVYEEALGYDSGSDSAAAHLCTALTRLGRFELAVRRCKLAVDAKDKKLRFLANLNMGIALLGRAAEKPPGKSDKGSKADKTEKVEKYLKAASKLDPDSPEPSYHLAKLAEALGDKKLADKRYDKACKLGKKEACAPSPEP